MIKSHFNVPHYCVPVGCFLAGSLCALGMAPYNIWPVFLIGFGVLYGALAAANNKQQAFFYGWLFGFGYFVFSLYWIGNALLVDGNPYIWAWPLAVCGLPALLAFFIAIPSVIAARCLNLKTWYGYLGFVAVFGGFEVLRGYAFTGFPWNLFGYTWAGTLPIAQIASLESVYSLSILSIFWLSVLGFWVACQKRIQKIVLSSFVIASFAIAFYWGSQRIPVDIAYHDDVSVKIVQPNTPQHEKWQRDKMEGHFQTALDLSRYNGNESHKTIIVWPETTLAPAYIQRPDIAEMLGEYPKEAQLITGALRYTPAKETYHNSIVTIHQNGRISNIYDKSHLVPFGEYIPFQGLIPLAPIAQFQGLERGSGLQNLKTMGGLSYSPLVCYEILFPNKVIAAGSQPDFIVNVTNDAWYGISAGPYQHFTKAQFRAIEEGIPVIRAANTGFSGMIDPYGRIIQRSELYETQSIRARLPQKAL